MNEKKKITIYDLAEMTGFSVGTVNRALNGKARIKEETRKLILETADKVGYKANPAAQGLHRNPIKIGVVMFCSVFEYVNDIKRGIQSAAEDLEKYNVSVDISLINENDPHQCVLKTAETLLRHRDEKVNGVVLFHSSNSEEDVDLLRRVIDELTEDGIPVATIANDISNSRRIFYVGINAFVAGRMAAEMLWLSCPHKDVALLTSSRMSEVNSQYLDGFFDFAGNDRFTGIKVYEHYDESPKVIRETERMLAENPELKGIYMTTASSTEACLHIRKLGLKDYNIITTDLLTDTPDILRDGIASAVIFQDPYRQGKSAIKSLYDYLLTKTVAADYSITPSIILSSNVSAYIGNK